jgi:hypothetical protein
MEKAISFDAAVELLSRLPIEDAPFQALSLAGNLTTAERFRLIYTLGFYATAESTSGPCSEMAMTRPVREALPGLLRSLGARSLLDAPCGDFNWMSQVDLSGIDYTGVDIVPDLIERNRQRFERKFLVADISRDELPPADLILCRDALIHLSNGTVLDTLRNFRRSGARWLLTTTFPGGGANRDIGNGQYRPIDLQAEPFHLGAPIAEINEDIPAGGTTEKRLALWDLQKLPF